MNKSYRSIFKKFVIPLFVFGTIIGLDLFSKIYAKSINLGFLNSGISWGLAQKVSSELISAASILIILLIVILLNKFRENRWILVALGMILAGGLGNLISRIMWGGVWDWITIGDFPSFNIADMLITIGNILFVSVFLYNEAQGDNYKDSR
jgi:signal peptidase II